MSIFAERLLNQLILSHQKSAELELMQTQLMTKTKQVNEVQESIKLVQEQLNKVDALRMSLDEMNKDEQKHYETVKEEEDGKLQCMNEEFKREIDALNNRAEQIANAERNAESDNRKMKAQLEIYNDHEASSSEKFNEVILARDNEVAKIEEQERKNAERLPVMQELVEAEKLALEQSRKAHAEIKCKVDECVARFDAFQQQLTRAKTIYDAAKEEQQRQSRKVQSLQSDRVVAIKRAQASCKERDVILAKSEVLEQKLKTLLKQIDKLNSITESLLAASVDDNNSRKAEKCENNQEESENFFSDRSPNKFH